LESLPTILDLKLNLDASIPTQRSPGIPRIDPQFQTLFQLFARKLVVVFRDQPVRSLATEDPDIPPGNFPLNGYCSPGPEV
jgi:hypothetical protein